MLCLGTAKDSLTYHNGRKFSTKDQDNDESSLNCAAHATLKGAWWYGRCWSSNLNGVYRNRTETGTFKWYGISTIKEADMKIKPVAF